MQILGLYVLRSSHHHRSGKHTLRGGLHRIQRNTGCFFGAATVPRPLRSRARTSKEVKVKEVVVGDIHDQSPHHHHRKAKYSGANTGKDGAHPDIDGDPKKQPDKQKSLGKKDKAHLVKQEAWQSFQRKTTSIFKGKSANDESLPAHGPNVSLKSNVSQLAAFESRDPGEYSNKQDVKLLKRKNVFADSDED